MSVEETEPLVEIIHNYRTYFVPESVLMGADALRMPDGTYLNLKLAGIYHNFLCTPCIYRLVAAENDDAPLPTLKVIELPEAERKPN